MKLILLALSAVLIASQQVPPVPPTPDGFVYGPPVTTNYTLDVFFDHLCSYSAQAFPGLYLYWSNNQHWLRMVVHIVPLPYHYYSFFVGRAGRFIQINYPANFTEYMSWMFNHQSKYLDTAQGWDQSTLYTNLATDTQTATGVNSTLVMNSLNDTSYNYDLRISWKYAQSKGISGTPMYMVNGVLVPAASGFTKYQDWQNFFNSLN